MATRMQNTSGLEELEQILLCQICLEPLKNRNPRILSCGHTFCETCLTQIDDENCSRRQFGIRSIACPNCRHETEIPDKGISKLPLNYSAEHANEMVRSLGQTELCNKCWVKGEFVNAEVKCVECDWKLCCFCKPIHDKLPGYSAHAVKSVLPKSLDDDGDLCRKHQHAVKMYCEFCVSPLCQTCLLEGQHDSHLPDIVDFGQALQQVRHKLADEKASLQLGMEKTNGLISNHLENIDQIGVIKKTLCARAASAKDEIDRQVAALEEKLDSCHLLDNERRLKDCTLFLEKSEDLIGSITSLEQSSSLEVLQHGRQLLTRLSKERETLNIPGEASVLALTEQTVPPWIGEIVTTVCQAGCEPSSSNKSKTHDSERSLDSKDYRNVDPIVPFYLVKEFKDLQIMCCGGIAILNTECAVFVARSEEELVLVNSISGDCSHFRRKVNTVSAKDTDVIYVGYHIPRVTRIRFVGHKFRNVKRFPIMCDAASRACVDSHDDIIVTCLEKKKTLIKKVNPNGTLVWKRQVDADLFHLYISVVMLQDEERIIVSDEKKGKVEILTSDGKAERTLELYEGPGFLQPAPRQITTSHRGTILVADFANHTVSEYMPGGAFIRHVLTEADGIKYPCVLACSEQGRLWLTEYNYLPPWRRLSIYQI